MGEGSNGGKGATPGMKNLNSASHTSVSVYDIFKQRTKVAEGGSPSSV